MSALLLALIPMALAAASLDDQVVTLHVTRQEWDTREPWTMQRIPPEGTAQAAVVAGPGGSRYLLTTAQMLERATFVRTSHHGDPDGTLAKIAWVDREANLALLTVEEPGFWESLRPVRLGKKKLSEGELTIARWRDNQLEEAEGRLAGATVVRSGAGVSRHLALRITTDMSGGGWAEPLFRGKEMVGLSVSQNRSEVYALPADTLRRWLADYFADGLTGPWPGDLGADLQSTESPALASYLGLERPRGLLVRGTAEGSSACGVLQKGDVLLSIDGQALDSEGNIRHPLYGLVPFNFLLSQHEAGEEIPLRVWRDGQEQDLSLPLRTYTGAHWLVPSGIEAPPPYLVAGGLVFRELDSDLTGLSTDVRIVSLLQRSAQTPERRRVVILSKVLPDPYNLGYQTLGGLVVEAVNGQPVDAVDEVAAALKQPEGGFHLVRFRPNPLQNDLVLDAASFAEADARILENYGVHPPFRAAPPPPDLGPPCQR